MIYISNYSVPNGSVKIQYSVSRQYAKVSGLSNSSRKIKLRDGDNFCAQEGTKRKLQEQQQKHTEVYVTLHLL